jgi:hypothetical protein
LYPALDLTALPGGGGGAFGPYQVPALPQTTQAITVTSSGEAARQELLNACMAGGAAVEVPNSVGRLGSLALGNALDCDITLGSEVILDSLSLGVIPGQGASPVARIRVRGGQIGNIGVNAGSTDIVFDGVTVNNAVNPVGSRNGLGIGLASPEGGFAAPDRVVFVNSIIRMVDVEMDPGVFDGAGYIGTGTNVMFAHNNIAASGNRNSWGFRLSGAQNFLIVDNVVRVPYHKLVRLNDADADYVYIRGGTWLRDDRLSYSGGESSDTWAQLGEDTYADNVFIHDPVVYLLPNMPPSFGQRITPVQAGRYWEARRIEWHVRSPDVMSDTIMRNQEDSCVDGAVCDYGVGTHQYIYDANLSFPAAPWHDLPNIAVDDPDLLPQ